MKVAVVGAGTMGSGIAQLCATAGHDTRLVDSSSEQLERAVRSVDTSLARHRGSPLVAVSAMQSPTSTSWWRPSLS
jgi:3-hydroxyacyl-CoA dehydrogenase